MLYDQLPSVPPLLTAYCVGGRDLREGRGGGRSRYIHMTTPYIYIYSYYYHHYHYHYCFYYCSG